MKTLFGDTPENLHNINRQSRSSPFHVVHTHWLASSAFRLLYYYYYYYSYYYYGKYDLEILALNIVTSTVTLRNISEGRGDQVCRKCFGTFLPLEWKEISSVNP